MYVYINYYVDICDIFSLIFIIFFVNRFTIALYLYIKTLIYVEILLPMTCISNFDYSNSCFFQR